MTYDFYKEFYLINAESEKKLLQDIKQYPEQLIACRKRLSELDELLKNGEDRCHISRDQAIFLRRIINMCENA